jgi:hypothetical protein
MKTALMRLQNLKAVVHRECDRTDSGSTFRTDFEANGPEEGIAMLSRLNGHF